MIRRLLKAAACGATMLLASVAPPVKEPLRVGSVAPDLIPRVPSGDVVVVWTFPTESLQNCTSPASEFRRLQRQYGARAHLVLIAVGDDPNILDPFLRRERLRPVVRRVTETEYARHFGATPVPAVHIIARHVMRETVSDSTWADGVPMSRRGIKQTAESVLE